MRDKLQSLDYLTDRKYKKLIGLYSNESLKDVVLDETN